MKISNRAALIVIALLLIVSLAAGFLLWSRRPEGTQVVISVNGREEGTYSLHKDQTVIIGPEDGSWHNTLEIRDGKASVIESDCSNQICVFTPPLSEDTIGIIVCLPHGLVVELREPNS